MRTKWTSYGVLVSMIIGLSLLGCAPVGRKAISDRPMWIDRPQESQSKDEIVVVGSGFSRAEAIDAALARLAQSIEVRVVSIEHSVTFGGVSSTVDGRSSDASSSLHRAIELLTDQRLPGVRIRRTWFDQHTSETYALAALNVRDAGQWLDARVDEAVQRVDQALSRSKSTNSDWATLSALRSARAAINDALDSALARDAIDPAALSFNPASDLRHRRQEIADAWRAAQSAFRVEIVARTNQSEPIAQAVERAIGGAGLAPAIRPAPVKIVCELALVPVASYDPGARAVRWTATIAAIDVHSRRVIDTLRLTGVELSHDEATNQAVQAAVDQTKKQITSFLDQIFEDH